MGRGPRDGPGEPDEGAEAGHGADPPKDAEGSDAGAARAPLLTVSEVAGELRVSNMTVYRLIKRGELAAVRIGKSYRIRRSDLDAYIEAGIVQSEQG